MKRCLLFILILMFMSSCSKYSYQINNELYQDSDQSNNKTIDISYPQITGLANKEIEKNANSLIKNIALSTLSNYSSLDNMNINTTYNITYKSDDYLSVSFRADALDSQQIHPLITNQTMTVNLKTGSQVKLRDIINISDNLVGNFLKLSKNISHYDEESFSKLVDDDVMQFLSIDDLLTCDDESNNDYHSYLTKDSIIISVAVPYQAGSYALYEFKYEDVKDYLRIKP